MAPFHNEPFISFAGGDVPANPMEEVLALQSYLPCEDGVDSCRSGLSCLSAQSSGFVIDAL